MNYCPRTDGRASYDEAIAELRRRYLAERLPGETAAQWSARVRAAKQTS